MSSPTHRFLILHGLGASGPDHWQTWLTGRLRERGSEVAYPDLPDPLDPQPPDWVEAADQALDAEPGVVVCHSLACLLWLRLCARGGDRLTERVLLVAPPWREDIPEIARFLDHGASADAVRRAAAETLIVYSPDDPYCPRGAVEQFAKPLETAYESVPDGGHLNPETGFGPWPWVEAWALRARA